MTDTLDVLMDYDDVLYGLSSRMHELCERAGITNGQEIRSWHIWNDYGCEKEQVVEVLRSACASGELFDGPILPDTLRHLRRLRYAGHRVHIVTARGFGEPFAEHKALIESMTRAQVMEWNVPFDTLTFSNDKTSVRADFALDDGIHNYEALHAAGVGAYLMDAVHNRHYYTFYRAHSVGQFVDNVLAFAEAGFPRFREAA